MNINQQVIQNILSKSEITKEEQDKAVYDLKSMQLKKHKTEASLLLKLLNKFIGLDLSELIKCTFGLLLNLRDNIETNNNQINRTKITEYLINNTKEMFNIDMMELYKCLIKKEEIIKHIDQIINSSNKELLKYIRSYIAKKISFFNKNDIKEIQNKCFEHVLLNNNEEIIGLVVDIMYIGVYPIKINKRKKKNSNNISEVMNMLVEETSEDSKDLLKAQKIGYCSEKNKSILKMQENVMVIVEMLKNKKERIIISFKKVGDMISNILEYVREKIRYETEGYYVDICVGLLLDFLAMFIQGYGKLGIYNLADHISQTLETFIDKRESTLKCYRIIIALYKQVGDLLDILKTKKIINQVIADIETDKYPHEVGEVLKMCYINANELVNKPHEIGRLNFAICKMIAKYSNLELNESQKIDILSLVEILIQTNNQLGLSINYAQIIELLQNETNSNNLSGGVREFCIKILHLNNLITHPCVPPIPPNPKQYEHFQSSDSVMHCELSSPNKGDPADISPVREVHHPSHQQPLLSLEHIIQSNNSSKHTPIIPQLAVKKQKLASQEITCDNEEGIIIPDIII